jgi:basic amino acid/polyamine antiporter, APA family
VARLRCSDVTIRSGGELQRRLGVSDAVVIGAGSMIGAGVFTAWAPAAGAAGTALVLGLVIAGVVAFCNATSSAQLAVVHPESGGTYVYGREQLGPAWGHLAGWSFVVGKTASCAAMALAVGAYLWPEQERTVAVVAVVVITVVNIGGLSRTVAVTRVLLVVSLLALGVVVVSGWSSDGADLGRLTPLDAGVLDVLRAAGFLFFAFAGYARIATLGEEVRDPAVTIPKAIPRALALVLVVYAVVGVTALAVVPSDVLAATGAPLRPVVDAGALASLAFVTQVGAGIAALGVLLNLIPGVSRTTLAMARRHELPGWFAHVDERRSLPLRAELTVAAVVIVLALTLDLRGAIAFSSVTVLTYYAITNASALTLPAEHRRWPRPVAVVGFVGCVVVALALPLESVIGGVVVLAVGVVIRLVSNRLTAG